MAVPYTFGSATTSIPLSQLDSNFATTITLGNTAIQLGNTVTTLNNMTLANVTVSSVSTAVTPSQGGTGLTTLTSNNVLLGNGTSSVAFVAPGTSGNVLTSNGTTWTSSASTGTKGPAFSAYSDSNQSVSNITGTVIAANVKEYDTAGCYNNTGSTVTLNGLSVPAYSFCPNVAGYYQINGGIQYAYSTCSRALIQITKNGAGYKRLSDLNTNPNSLTGGAIVYFNGTGDYVAILGYINGTGTLTFNGSSGDQTLTWINGSMIRSA
jgi:hypothetical protein